MTRPNQAVLSGVKVLDMSRILAGPWCAMMLGDLGADVIKVENPDGGDDTRHLGTAIEGGERTYYLCVNRNKRSIAIDLTTPQRRALFTGDILHHPIQIAIPEWNSNFCGDALQARASRRQVLERCVDTGAVLMPAHFGHPHCGHVHRQGNAFSFQPVEPDA